jgi:ribosomal protein S2
VRYALAGQPVVIAINNKAEGSAPLSCVELAREIVEAYARQAQEREPENEGPSQHEREPQPGDDGEPGDERGFQVG